MDHKATLAVMNAIARGDANYTYRVAIVAESGTFEGNITVREEYLRCLARFACPSPDEKLREHLVYELNTTERNEARTYVTESHDARRVLRGLVLSEVDPHVSLSDPQIRSLDRWRSERVYLSRVAARGLLTQDSEHAAIAFDIDEVVSWYPVRTIEIADADYVDSTR